MHSVLLFALAYTFGVYSVFRWSLKLRFDTGLKIQIAAVGSLVSSLIWFSILGKRRVHKNDIIGFYAFTLGVFFGFGIYPEVFKKDEELHLFSLLFVLVSCLVSVYENNVRYKPTSAANTVLRPTVLGNHSSQQQQQQQQRAALPPPLTIKQAIAKNTTPPNSPEENSFISPIMRTSSPLSEPSPRRPAKIQLNEEDESFNGGKLMGYIAEAPNQEIDGEVYLDVMHQIVYLMNSLGKAFEWGGAAMAHHFRILEERISEASDGKTDLKSLVLVSIENGTINKGKKGESAARSIYKLFTFLDLIAIYLSLLARDKEMEPKQAFSTAYNQNQSWLIKASVKQGLRILPSRNKWEKNLKVEENDINQWAKACLGFRDKVKEIFNEFKIEAIE